MGLSDIYILNRIRQYLYFNSDIPNYKEYNKAFYNMTIKLMTEALKLKDKEVLLLMNNSTYEYRMTTSYMQDTVYLTTEMANAITEYSTNTYTAFHNHPNNKPFSSRDLYMLLKYDKISIMVVCNNNCKETYLLNKDRALSIKEKEEIMKINLDFSTECTDKLAKYGINYINKKGRSN